MRNVFKSFDEIGTNNRSGVIISPTTKGLKIETFSTYNDEKEYIYYINETPNFNRDTNWNANWNDTTKYWEALLHSINLGITPYRVIEK